MTRGRLWLWGLVVALGVGVLIVPRAVAQPSNLEISVEAPPPGATIFNGQTVDVSGWAVDTSMADGLGPGIASIELTVDTQNGASGDPPTAMYGISRPDVAAQLGRPDWDGTGFRFSWTPSNLPIGENTLQIWVTSSEGLSRLATVALMVAAPPATPTLTPVPRTPSPTNPPYLMVNPRMGCDIDVTLLAPANFSRPCPTRVPTRTPEGSP